MRGYDWKVGDSVDYLRVDRGGYGLVSRVPATVIGVTDKRVRIRTERFGDTSVAHESLRRRNPTGPDGGTK